MAGNARPASGLGPDQPEALAQKGSTRKFRNEADSAEFCFLREGVNVCKFCAELLKDLLCNNPAQFLQAILDEYRLCFNEITSTEQMPADEGEEGAG